MKYLWIPFLLLTGCASQAPTVSPVEPIETTSVITEPVSVEIVPTVNRNHISEMMSQAARCSGTVKFQAEIENDKTRARFTCEWTETEETQAWW